MKKHTGILTLLFCFVFLAHQVAVTFNTVPPTGKTGAPGEVSCMTLGCHPTIGTTGSISVTFNNGTNVYFPDSIYDIEITVQDSGNTIFGFQLTALDVLEQPQGNLITTNTSNTYLSIGANREYISHLNAFDSLNFGLDSFLWQFQWKAPPIAQDSIIFYFTGIASDQIFPQPIGDFYINNLEIRPTSVNLPPQASNKSISTSKNVSVNVDLNEAAYDPNGDAVSFVLLDDPDSGVSTLTDAGLLQYIPNPGFAGQDTLSYSICDDSSLCDTGMVFIEISLTPGLNQITEIGAIKLWPNPSSGIINVKGHSLEYEILNLELYNIEGQLIWHVAQEKGMSSPFQVNLSDFPNGIYMLKVGEDLYGRIVIAK